MSMNIKKGDTVVRISGDVGKDKDLGNTKGKILEVMPKAGKVIVEGMNVAQKHQKPRQQGEEGGIISKETPMYACKVQLVCPKCGKPTRVAHKRVKKVVSGKEKMVSIRVCKKCGAEDI
ncbi:MAG: 50S ribosomal protein L24 [Oscillospiraceae bacterium]|nr:50S ribosomal protein L24 [Oscillospiraceae bacterium]